MLQAHSHQKCNTKAVQEYRLKGSEVDFPQPDFVAVSIGRVGRSHAQQLCCSRN
jgi:hypothetical protein